MFYDVYAGAYMTKTVKDEKRWKPSFTVVCPGGQEARFERRDGDLLYWRGALPYLWPNSSYYYTLVTTLTGEVVRTEDGYLPDRYML
jgi:hypothetical protein